MGPPGAAAPAAGAAGAAPPPAAGAGPLVRGGASAGGVGDAVGVSSAASNFHPPRPKLTSPTAKSPIIILRTVRFLTLVAFSSENTLSFEWWTTIALTALVTPF